MKQDVLQATSMTVPALSRSIFVKLREHKTIPVQPVRTLRVEFQEFVEENMGHRGHAHGGSWMTRVGFAWHIDRQATDCVDAFPIEFAVIRFCHGGECSIEVYRIPSNTEYLLEREAQKILRLR